MKTTRLPHKVFLKRTMKNFKIETVKWEWAKSVKNKSVYRDDEFVRTKTKEEALDAIDFLMNRPNGLTYTITVFRDGEYFTYFRYKMPCLGGLCKYRDSHGSKHFYNPFFPRDIYVAFPEGEIIFIACQGQFPKTDFNDFIFSEESPWISAFDSKDTILFKKNYFILTNMDTDPTVFYHFMRYGRNSSYSAYSGYGGGQVKNWNPKAEILLTKTGMCDPRRLAGQKPIRISGGTWAEGFGYTRPYNESIFKTKLPHKFKDLGKSGDGGYPQAPYTNEYFLKTMKKEFGVDMGSAPKDKKLEEILLKAWDYFKKEAEKLDE
jgi:hypothetical protein